MPSRLGLACRAWFTVCGPVAMGGCLGLAWRPLRCLGDRIMHGKLQARMVPFSMLWAFKRIRDKDAR